MGRPPFPHATTVLRRRASKSGYQLQGRQTHIGLPTSGRSRYGVPRGLRISAEKDIRGASDLADGRGQLVMPRGPLPWLQWLWRAQRRLRSPG